jgi:hypothetical protein
MLLTGTQTSSAILVSAGRDVGRSCCRETISPGRSINAVRIRSGFSCSRPRVSATRFGIRDKLKPFSSRLLAHSLVRPIRSR